jgi:chromosome segregation ATPase
MAETDGPLTLEGLAQILRDHMDGTAARFAEVGRRIDDLRGEIGTVAGVVRNLGQIVLRQADQFEEHRRELEEHRGEIRRIYARMEQHEARTEAMTRDIRRILDAIERRGGDGGARAE